MVRGRCGGVGYVHLGSDASDEVDIKGTIKSTAGNVKIDDSLDVRQGLTVDGALSGKGR